MHSFEVHSNESACRKSRCLGLEQVIKDVGFKFELHKNRHFSPRNMINRNVDTYQKNLEPTQYLEKVRMQVSVIEQINSGIL